MECDLRAHRYADRYQQCLEEGVHHPRRAGDNLALGYLYRAECYAEAWQNAEDRRHDAREEADGGVHVQLDNSNDEAVNDARKKAVQLDKLGGNNALQLERGQAGEHAEARRQNRITPPAVEQAQRGKAVGDAVHQEKHWYRPRVGGHHDGIELRNALLQAASAKLAGSTAARERVDALELLQMVPAHRGLEDRLTGVLRRECRD